jgi:sugar lactone lactonase YvrE
VLGAPQKVAVDRNGNLFIADWDEETVREVVASTGVIERVAGNDVQGYSGDGGPSIQAEMSCPDGIAFDASGAMYIADYANGVVRKVTPQ